MLVYRRNLPAPLRGGSAGAERDVTVIAKTAEMIINYAISRRSTFARPPEKALKEFLDS